MEKGEPMTLKESYPTEVYISQAGFLCIKQETYVENCVMLSYEQSQRLLEYLEANQDELNQAWGDGVRVPESNNGQS